MCNFFSSVKRAPQTLPLTVVLFSVILYLPALQFEFVWDDSSYVVQNEWVREWSQLPSFFYSSQPSAGAGAEAAPLYRPIRNLSYLLDYKLWGLHPAGWHAQNIFWHALAALLVFYILKRLTRDETAAFLAALLFAAHPVLTETVAWVKARDALLAAVFGLGAFLLFLDAGAKQTGWRWVCGVTLLYALAVFSYLIALSFFFVFLLAIWLLPGEWLQSNRKTTLIALTATLIVSIAFVLSHTAVLGRIEQQDYLVRGSFYYTMLSMLPALQQYLLLSFLPLQLNADYLTFPQQVSPWNFAVLSSAGMLLALGLAAVWLYRAGRRMTLFAIGWFFAFLLPVANIIPTMQLLAERFLYLSLVAVALLFAQALVALRARIPTKRIRLDYFAAIALIGLCVMRTELRLPVWKNDLNLSVKSWAQNPDNPRALSNYCSALMKNRQYREALPQLLRHRELFPPAEKIYFNLADAYFKLSEPAAARVWSAEGLSHFPEFAPLHSLAAQIAAAQSDFDAAIESSNRAIALDPAALDYQLNLGVIYQNRGDYDAARKIYLGLQDKMPDSEQLFTNLARVAYHSKQPGAALEYYHTVLRINPQQKEALEMTRYLNANPEP